MDSNAAGRQALISTPGPLWPCFFLCGLLFLPGALGYMFEGSSFTTGTVVICIIALCVAALGKVGFGPRDMQRAMVLAGLVCFAIIVHMVAALSINADPDVDLVRAAGSLLVLALVLLTAPIFTNATMATDADLTLTIKIVGALFILIAIFSVAKIQPPTESLGAKPTFPYTEPSFFGFSCPAILLFVMARSRLVERLAWFGAFAILAVALGNFTVVIACALAACATLPLSWLIGGGVVAVAGSASLDLSYYTGRLDFDWANSSNLSALVYVQGWQMLSESLGKSFAWGLGFQQLGILYTNVPASVRINALLGRDANLQDGGFVLSKLGSELGMIGLVLLAVYLWVASKSFLKIRRATAGVDTLSDGDLFARCCIVGYVIEIAIRGTNYFTGTAVLTIAALVYLQKRRIGAAW